MDPNTKALLFTAEYYKLKNDVEVIQFNILHLICNILFLCVSDFSGFFFRGPLVESILCGKPLLK